MARLRKEPITASAAPPQPQQVNDEGDSDVPRRRPARRNAPKRYTVPDDSSAEESEKDVKLVQKQKGARRGQVRLAPERSLLSSKTVAEEDVEPRRRPKARRPQEKLRRPVLEHSAESLKKSSPPRPILESEVEVDVEESIWCGDSDSSSASDLPSPRKFLRFPRQEDEAVREVSGTVSKEPVREISGAASREPIRKTSGIASKIDFTKQFQALSIFDDDDFTFHKPAPKKSVPQSRPGSSSDKENNHAIIRFSPPRLKSPTKKAAVERPSTPPPPPSPSKGKLQSPSKKAARIPTPPLRPSLDAFWTADAVNDWNDQYSPQKPLKSPRKLKFQPDDSPTTSPNKCKSPSKKEELQAKKTFDSTKISLAETFLHDLDSTITNNQISTLSASTGGVQLIWSKTLNSTAGRANWRRETTKTKTASGTITETHKHFASIELATKVISSPERLYNVLAHEFCHLANFMISNIKTEPHGKSFKEWGRKVTAAFGSSHGVEVTTKHTYEIEYKYVWQCRDEECGVEFKRHSKSIDVQRHRCGVCKGELVQVKPVPRGGGGGKGTPTGTGYAAYVKEHFAAVKKSLPSGATHKEVMEALGKKYRSEKAAAGLERLTKQLDNVKLGGTVEIIELD